MADALRSTLRTGFLSRMHLSSKNRFPLAICTGFGARESFISRCLPFRPQIRDARGSHLTF